MTTSARTLVLKQITEAEWQGWVQMTARTFGWLTYHTHDSRRSEAGFPDLVLVRDTELLFVELKREGGKPTAAQQVWLDALAQVNAIEVHVWLPSQQDEVLERLRRSVLSAARESA